MFKKHNGTFEQKSDNDHPTIAAINQWIDLPKKSPYCGSTIVWMCKEAGVQLVDIPITQMGLARNWKRHGRTIWDSYNGWRAGAPKQPRCDEIWVLYFNWNGRNHVAVMLWNHGGLNFISGEGNTSNKKVRRKKYGESELVGKTSSVVDLYVPASKNKSGKPVYRQGIFAYKERYKTAGLVGIVSIKVKLL